MIHNFKDFIKSTPARWVCRAMFRQNPEDMGRTWSTFTYNAHLARDTFAGIQDPEPAEAWITHVRHGMGVWSSGERALCLAVLHAIDYDWLADEFATVYNECSRDHESRAFSILSKASGEWAEAVGACFARVDPQTLSEATRRGGRNDEVPNPRGEPPKFAIAADSDIGSPVPRFWLKGTEWTHDPEQAETFDCIEDAFGAGRSVVPPVILGDCDSCDDDPWFHLSVYEIGWSLTAYDQKSRRLTVWDGTQWSACETPPVWRSPERAKAVIGAIPPPEGFRASTLKVVFEAVQHREI